MQAAEIVRTLLQDEPIKPLRFVQPSAAVKFDGFAEAARGKAGLLDG
jgi:hypothetical protein